MEMDVGTITVNGTLERIKKGKISTILGVKRVIFDDQVTVF